MLLFHMIDRKDMILFDQDGEEGEQEMEEDIHEATSQKTVQAIPELKVSFHLSL